jgi:hypothetical protein
LLTITTVQELEEIGLRESPLVPTAHAAGGQQPGVGPAADGRLAHAEKRGGLGGVEELTHPPEPVQ